MEVNLRMKELRGNRSQQEIANELGLNRQTYRYYESGERQADYETLFKIADFYGVTIDYLLGHNTKKQPTQSEQTDIFHANTPKPPNPSETPPLPQYNKEKLNDLFNKLTNNQRSLVVEYADTLYRQSEEQKHCNEIRYNFIFRYRELIDNSFFRTIMELFLHIKPQDYGDFLEMFSRFMEKKGYNTSKYYIEAINYFNEAENPIRFTSTALRDQFIEDYQDLIGDISFEETAKLYKSITPEERKLVVEIMISFCDQTLRKNTSPIIGR